MDVVRQKLTRMMQFVRQKLTLKSNDAVRKTKTLNSNDAVRKTKT